MKTNGLNSRLNFVQIAKVGYQNNGFLLSLCIGVR